MSEDRPAEPEAPETAVLWVRLGKVLTGAGVLVMAVAVVWLGGLIWFAGTIPREAPASDAPSTLRQTDAIVVLTGGSERLATGLELLAAGRARKLFVSGVHHGVDLDELMRKARLAAGDLECCIVLGHQADNTVGNAAETAAWMRKEGFQSLRLVTGNYHMRRSLLEFSMAFSAAEMVPHPVAPPNVRLYEWWLWPGTTNLIVGEYNKYLVALVRYWLNIPPEAALEPPFTANRATPSKPRR